MSKMLINENPVLIVPSLAVKIGLNEAVILQQIHFWLTISKHKVEGEKWVYNTYLEWQKQLPFWSVSTIKRTIHSLERRGYLRSGNWNVTKMDQTKWYTIDYAKLLLLDDSTNMPPTGQFESVSSQIEFFNDLGSATEQTSLTQAIPESTTENTTEKNIPIVEIIQYLNEKTNAAYKPTTAKTQEMIKARVREGFTLLDFKRVIDLKTEEWLEDRRMRNYLRPATLFGNKFESYLNQKPCKKTLNEEDFDLYDEE